MNKRRLLCYTVARVVLALFGVALVITNMLLEPDHNWFLCGGMLFIAATVVINNIAMKKSKEKQ